MKHTQKKTIIRKREQIVEEWKIKKKNKRKKEENKRIWFKMIDFSTTMINETHFI